MLQPMRGLLASQGYQLNGVCRQVLNQLLSVVWCQGNSIILRGRIAGFCSCQYPWLNTLIKYSPGLTLFSLRVLIIGGFFNWFGCSFLFFLLLFFLLLIIYFLFFYFNNFILFYFISFFFSLLFQAMWLTGSWCSGLVSGQSVLGGRAEFRTLDHQRPPSPT